MKKPARRRTRQEWILAALATLRDEGVERVRVEPLAAKLGVTKGSFYWHFESREALVDAALDAWAAQSTEAIIHEVSSSAEDPRTVLRELWKRTQRDSSDEMRTELAIRDLAQRDQAVRERVRQVDERRMEFLRIHFRAAGWSAEQAEARSLMLYSLLIGNYFIRARHGRLPRAKVLSVALDELLAN